MSGWGRWLSVLNFIPEGRAGRLGLTKFDDALRALRFADEGADAVRRAETATHHIVARSDPRAAGARHALARFGIDINAPENRVVLPANLGSPNPTGAVVHSATHTNEYYRQLDALLVQATTRERAIEILDDIRLRLLAGDESLR